VHHTLGPLSQRQSELITYCGAGREGLGLTAKCNEPSEGGNGKQESKTLRRFAPKERTAGKKQREKTSFLIDALPQ